MTSNPTESRAGWGLSSRVLLLAGVVALAALAFAVLWAAHASDRLSVDR